MRRIASRIDRQAIYRAASKSSLAGILVQTIDGTVLWANDAYGRIMGHDPDSLVGKHPLAFALPPEDRPSDAEIAQFRFVKPTDDKPRVEVFRNRRGDGTLIWLEIQVAFDQIRGFGEVVILAARDISDQVAQREKLEATTADLRRLATTDSLTGLANRHAFMRTLRDALAAQSQSADLVALMNIDLDHFKSINDSHGHAAGDAMLAHLATILAEVLGPDDVAARIGGDEFVVLSRNAVSLSHLAERAHELLIRFARPLTFEDATLEASLSIGAATADDADMTADTLLKRADLALYQAKDRGRGQVVVYDQALHDQQREAAIFATEVRGALSDQQLAFMFQPSMRLRDGEIAGFETLVRWNHPRHGFISPAEFLPVVRNLGLMASLDFAAFEAAITLVQQMSAAGFTQQHVSFNASAELLAQDGFADTFLSRLNQEGIAPDRIVVEVLETVVIATQGAKDVFARVIGKLTENGVKVLLDDFGTGYAGLTHLAKLAVSGVKIDRSLTENILTDRSSAKIIAMMHDLCHELDMDVVTEGIESKDQAAALWDLGGRVLQGFWLAKAMPSDVTLNWLKTHKAERPFLSATAIADTSNRRYLGANLS